MEKQSARNSVYNEAVKALELESAINERAFAKERRGIRNLLQEWNKTMESPRVRKEYERITGGVDPQNAEGELRKLAA